MSQQVLKKRGRKPKQVTETSHLPTDIQGEPNNDCTQKCEGYLHIKESIAMKRRRLDSSQGQEQLKEEKKEPFKFKSFPLEMGKLHVEQNHKSSEEEEKRHPYQNSELKQKNEEDKQRMKDADRKNEIAMKNSNDSDSFSNLKDRPRRNKTSDKVANPENCVSREELRMIKLALKNSLLESSNSINELDEIELVKTYYPTQEEFLSPLEFIEKLYQQGAAKYGIVKIVPPKDFQPILAFDQFSKQKMPTRFQVLQDLAQGKPFEQNAEGATFEEFARLSKQIEKEETVEDFWKLEKEYWNYVENQVGPRIKVQYAADLEATHYGSGFGKKDQPIFDNRATQYFDHPWNLNNFYKQSESLMQFPRSKDLSGINIPWMYVGMKYSTFCWHYEDLMLYSINYNHWGKPKLWYGIAEDQRERFDKVVKEKIALLFKKDPNILLDIITMISPTYLAKHKIKVYKTLQMPGEFVLTFPGSYHAGFSTGLNIGEAVNFVSKSWFDYGFKCQQIYRKSREKIPVFPLDWLLVQNITHLGDLNLSAETKKKVRECYSKVLKEELALRESIESEIKDQLDASHIKRPISYLMEDRENVAEDAHQCNYCTDFAYLSVLRCKNHKIKYCINHGLVCGCPIENIQLVYRYSTKELEKLDQKIKDVGNKVKSN